MTSAKKFALAAAAALALVAGLATTSTAQETEEPAPGTVTLGPGWNSVGWVGEAIDVDDVFAAIPEAEQIAHWDADRRVVRFAFRDVLDERTLATLEPGMAALIRRSLAALEPGMAALIRISGDEPVEWERPLAPARGSVRLHKGVNWVTWLGRDNWPLDQVARGIGKSLVSIHLGNEVYTPPFDAADVKLPVVRRGDVLMVRVARDLRWLQPTGVMPTIVWVGEIGPDMRDEINADVRYVLDYFADAFAVEADFAETTILVWKGVEAAVRYAESDPEIGFLGRKGDELRIFLTDFGAGASAPSYGVWISACVHYPDDACIRPQGQWARVLAHEYFHHIQNTLPESPPSDRWRVSPWWMIEGGAIWGGDLGLPIAGEPLFSVAATRDWVAGASATLKSAEQINGPWQHGMGVHAFDLLAADGNRDAVFEYWRLLHPQAIEPERRWTRYPSWEEAFEGAFGLEVDDFYQQFEAWRDEWPGRGLRYSHYPGEPTLRGTLRHADGTPAAGFRVFAAAYKSGYAASGERNVIVGSDGAFSIGLQSDTAQRIWVKHDTCTLHLGKRGLTTDYPAAWQFRELDTNNLPTLNLTLPEGACQHSVQARLLRIPGDNRNLEVLLFDRSWAWAQGVYGVYGDGFTIFSPAAGDYRLSVRIGECELWYRSGRLVASPGTADLIRVDGEVRLPDLRIPDHLCE